MKPTTLMAAPEEIRPNNRMKLIRLQSNSKASESKSLDNKKQIKKTFPLVKSMPPTLQQVI